MYASLKRPTWNVSAAIPMAWITGTPNSRAWPASFTLYRVWPAAVVNSSISMVAQSAGFSTMASAG